MPQRNYKMALLGVGIGTLLQLVGIFVRSPIGMDELLSAIFIISGYSLFVWGCHLYAKNKGYMDAWGFMGLFSLPGLLILYFLKDKTR